MKILTVLFALVIAVSLLFVTDAHQRKRRSNDALREQLLDYLHEAKRNQLLLSLEKQMQRRREQSLMDDDNDDSDRYERGYARRKVVGLGDEPF